MNITFSGAAPALENNVGLQSAGSVAQRRQLSQAVKQLNQSSLIPDNRELSIAIDPKTKLTVVRVLDSNTHEVLDQFPAEYVLRITAYLESEIAEESLSKIPALGR